MNPVFSIVHERTTVSFTVGSKFYFTTVPQFHSIIRAHCIRTQKSTHSFRQIGFVPLVFRWFRALRAIGFGRKGWRKSYRPRGDRYMFLFFDGAESSIRNTHCNQVPPTGTISDLISFVLLSLIRILHSCM
mmetsp:Transcript_25999/g.71325  ORF Transcript_25999/g.71325 Transcript_25999/m.71325 type:complete len:131 (-) Transcript_25999:308-700(-)